MAVMLCETSSMAYAPGLAVCSLVKCGGGEEMSGSMDGAPERRPVWTRGGGGREGRVARGLQGLVPQPSEAGREDGTGTTASAMDRRHMDV